RDYQAPELTEIGRVEDLTQEIVVAGDETAGGS
ncbi:MAG: lasso RiPP family leader peptide-containing protein, partial [Actinobacteria bacterium]|nr:lasso RiPP family leader peptide-containing protein [Actinomycetota bacterium]